MQKWKNGPRIKDKRWKLSSIKIKNLFYLFFWWNGSWKARDEGSGEGGGVVGLDSDSPVWATSQILIH